MDKSNMESLLFFPERTYENSFGLSAMLSYDDANLVKRIIREYKFAVERFEGYGTSLWGGIHERNLDIHKALLSGDHSLVSALLRDPGQHNLLYGFENLFRDYASKLKSNPERQRSDAQWIHDALARLAEAVGAIRTSGPESPYLKFDLGVEKLITAIETRLDFQLLFPNPFPGEFGIITSRGCMSVRAVHAIYQAWRIKELLFLAKGGKVLEIGAGLGRTAFYSYLAGVKDYTIVDLPLTNVAQAYFLGRVLGEEHIVIGGEPKSNDPNVVHICDSALFSSSGTIYNLVLNVDSMTELDPRHAQNYFDVVSHSNAVFVSINHEAHAFRVSDFAANRGRKLLRFPYWMRKGYVEEIGLFS
jgi:hypothetical protein